MGQAVQGIITVVGLAAFGGAADDIVGFVILIGEIENWCSAAGGDGPFAEAEEIVVLIGLLAAGQEYLFGLEPFIGFEDDLADVGDLDLLQFVDKVILVVVVELVLAGVAFFLAVSVIAIAMAGGEGAVVD